MTKKQILEFNKKCAQFLGAYWCNDDLEAYPNGYWMIDDDDIDLGSNLEDMLFDCDWNWIMHVYIKINNFISSKSETDYIFGKETNEFHLKLWNAFEGDCTKEGVVEAIDYFLTWYYNNRKTN